MTSTGRARSWWGWGWQDHALGADQLEALAAAVAARLGVAELEVRMPPAWRDLDLRPSRVQAPASLAELCSTDVEDRAAHTHGKSFRDVVRNVRGQLDHPP